jgi:hypothetical protein
MKPSLVS